MSEMAGLNRLIGRTRSAHGFPFPCRALVVLLFDAQDRRSGAILDVPWQSI